MKYKSFIKSPYLWIIVVFVILFIILFFINFKINIGNLKDKQKEIKNLNQQYIKNIKNLKKQYASKLKILRNKNKALSHKLYNHDTNTYVSPSLKLNTSNNSKKAIQEDKISSQRDFYNTLLSTDTEIIEKGEIMDSNPLNNPPPQPSPTLHL
ncbi:MAG: hypothetical protein GY756_09000 [bacterium]|nr:hypothetical protein [bacterium]